LTTFSDLGLPAPILKALTSEGYETPTPIQAGAIPHVLAGRDLLGLAQTGTGKTAAFSLPILSRLAADPRRPGPRACRVLVLSPTRELASQIEASITTYGRFLRLTSTLVFGGVPIGRQIRAMGQGVDIVVATPGRLLDLMNQRAITLAEVSTFVLDEADRMLDLGFMRDIQKIVQALPAKRQNLFFSATMPQAIARLAASMLKDPIEVKVAPVSATADRIDQSLVFCPTRDKQAMLHHLLADASISRALVRRQTAQRRRHQGRRHSRQQVAGPARAGPGGVPGRQCAAPGRNRYRGPRHRCRRRHPCDQLRPAEHCRNLCPPDRPHGPRRGGRQGDFAGG
jgi:ATP-dependent RNA helicase RhlE